MEEVGIRVLLDGNLIQASGLARFTYIPTGKDYLIYSLNEKIAKDGVELNKLYVSEIGEGTVQPSIISQDDWVAIQGIMSELSEAEHKVPDNIQLGILSPNQYNVGPHKKIAVADDLKNGIIATQLAKQPKESAEVIPTVSKFIAPQEEAAIEPTVQGVQVPNAFDMSAPVPEQTAPITLVGNENNVQQEEVQTIPEPVQTIQQTIIQPTITQPAQTVVQEQTTVVEQQPTVVEKTVVEDQPAVVIQQPVGQTQPTVVDINKSVQDVINYSKGNLNVISELFNNNGLNIVVSNKMDNIQTVQTSQPGTIDITNLPVASQPTALPSKSEEALYEESFVPTVPTIPDEDSRTNVNNGPVTSVTNNFVVQQPTIPVPPVVEQPVVQQPTVPVQTIVQQPTIPVQQPVAQPIVQTQTIVQQPVAEQPVIQTQTVVEQPMVQTQVVQQPVVEQSTVLVQPDVQEQVVEQSIVTQQPIVQEQPVQTVIQAQPTQPVVQEEPAPLTTSQVVQEAQNSEVSFDIPEEVEAPVDNTNFKGIPTIVPLTADDYQAQAPDQPISQMPEITENPEENKSFINAAGPVIIPIGQERVNTAGSPGDSGAMTRAA